jgi:hypothetical protein
VIEITAEREGGGRIKTLSEGSGAGSIWHWASSAIPI